MAIESVNASSGQQRAKQKRLQLYLWGLFRVLVTVLLIGGTVGLLKGFSKKEALGRTQKYTFNTIMILLTLLLGINMTVSPGLDRSLLFCNTNPTLNQIAHSQVVRFIREGITHRNASDTELWPFRKVCSCDTLMWRAENIWLLRPLAQKIPKHQWAALCLHLSMAHSECGRILSRRQTCFLVVHISLVVRFGMCGGSHFCTLIGRKILNNIEVNCYWDCPDWPYL